MAYQPPPPPAAPTRTNGIAIAGMVCGIVGLVFAFLVPIIGIITGILGVVFGFLGRKRATETGGMGAGQAMTGIITGILGVVIAIIWIVYVASVVF